MYLFLIFSEGPKNYAYKTREENGNELTTCKVRGLTLNYQVSQIVNFETVKNFVLKDNPDPIIVHYPTKIARRHYCEVVTKPMVKKYNRVPPKRRVLANYSTLPFGYVDEWFVLVFSNHVFILFAQRT